MLKQLCRSKGIATALTIWLSSAFAVPAAPAAPSKPNFLIILADDMGFSDAACYGGEIQTPNLDRLAANGLRFTQFYNTARCWPTRSSILTGYYAQQIGMDPRKGRLPPWTRVVPHYLKPLGYRCYHSGKWHLTAAPKPVADGGFDRSYWFEDWDRYFSPAKHFEDDHLLPPIKPDSGYYATTAFADHAIHYLEDHAANYGGQPFFLYLAFISPHFPLQALEADIARYRDRYLQGWDVVREQRWQRLRHSGIVDCALPPLDPQFTPRYLKPDLLEKVGTGEVEHPVSWATLTGEQKRFQATKMAIHAAMVDRMDREIGRVLDQLRVMGALDNTVIFFLSDNGADATLLVRGEGHDRNAPAGSWRSFLCLGPGWASASNTPFRWHKIWVHEGGISTPLIVHWPDGIKARGELRRDPGHVIDFVPTLLELAGANVSNTWNGAAAPPLPGRSLAPAFKADNAVHRDFLFFEHEGNRALRMGNWKLVSARENDNRWELYDLGKDRSELHDLAGQQPERARRMEVRWNELESEFSAGTGTVSSASSPRPNILIYVADDMSWAHTSIGGDPAVKTPNFDRLARSGVRFSHAFCSSPSCTPSRAALLTGQAFCRLEQGASLLSTLPAKFPVYPDLLERAGYQIGFSGKGWAPGDWRPGGRIRNPAGPPFSSLGAFLQKLPPGKPFCFWAGSHDPHRPYGAGSGIKSGIDPSQVVVPPIVPDTPEIRSDLADYLFEVQRFDSGLAVLLKDLETHGLLNNTLVVVTSDNGMPYPRGKCNLYDWGTRMPLAIAWPGKIPPNRTIDDFVSLTDLAPTFLEATGLPVPAEMTGRSLLRMLLSDRSSRVEKERDRVFFGRERHDSFRLEDNRSVGYPMRAVRTEQFLYIRNFKPHRFPSGDDPSKNQDNDRGPAKTFVVTHRDDPAVKPFYERAYGKRPAEELYNLAEDSGALNNVAGDPAYAQTRARLQADLDSWMTKVDDPRRPQSPNPDVFDQYPIQQRPR